jgi:hypothetical protein
VPAEFDIPPEIGTWKYFVSGRLKLVMDDDSEDSRYYNTNYYVGYYKDARKSNCSFAVRIAY